MAVAFIVRIIIILLILAFIHQFLLPAFFPDSFEKWSWFKKEPTEDLYEETQELYKETKETAGKAGKQIDSNIKHSKEELKQEQERKEIVSQIKEKFK